MGNFVEEKEDKKEYYYPNYAVTRKQKRFIANRKMKEANQKNYRRHSYEVLQNGSFEMYTRKPSFFAEHWRDPEYQEVEDGSKRN